MGRSSAILRQTNRAGARAECGIAAVIRATQVSPLRCGMLVRDIAAGHPGGRTGRMRHCGATTRDNARRGAIYDARCRNGTTRPWHCVGRCTRWCRQIAILRRSSGRHKCRPYDAGCSSAELRRSSGRHKCRPYVAGCSSTTLRQAVAVSGRRFLRRGRS